MIVTLIIVNSAILVLLVIAIREVRKLVAVQEAGLEKYRKNKARRQVKKIIAAETERVENQESGNHGY